MLACVFCGSPVADRTHACARCGRTPLHECARVVQVGFAHHLGITTRGDWAVWLPNGAMAGYWSLQDEHTARAAFVAWEQRSALTPYRPQSRLIDRTAAIVLGSTAVVFIVVYLIIHSARYSHCVVQPGLLSWPSVCL